MKTVTTVEFQFLIGRLVTFQPFFTRHPAAPFQFLIGRLVTDSGVAEGGREVAFQFLIGRLVTPLPRQPAARPGAVSIPHR